MRIRVLIDPAAGPVSTDDAVIVDVLRATTTLTVALANGAGRVFPVATPEEALRRRAPSTLLCGEREGRRIPGFDLGNSPDEYGPDTVAGRDLVFASTNGSRAMLVAQTARRRVLAAFVNAAAVVETLRGASAVTVVCSGKLGELALEDLACAGLLCRRWVARGASLDNPAARLAYALAPRDVAEVRALVQGSAHGRTLRAMGPEFARDVDRCAELDTIDRAFVI